ncbi:hypothetical protein ACEWY4_016298 [Coilia grayii]|uniref:AIG1-type G domain-containing protein n=1 Tax=Coilia grayii TaxID=363190 RepID=A0ABD1JK02_9TELE
MKDTLDDLSEDDFKEFRHRLSYKGKILWGKLENADRWDTVNLMVRVYSGDAGDVMVSVLKGMKHNHLAKALKKKCKCVTYNPFLLAYCCLFSCRALACFGMLPTFLYLTSPYAICIFAARCMTWFLVMCVQAGPDLTVVLLGKTGSGKSAAANAILGREAFCASKSWDPVTKECGMEQGEFDGKTIAVIDTPGVFDDQLCKKMMPFLKLQPHVFLLTISVNEKVTDELKYAVKWIEDNLGRDVLCYVIILFTYVDQLQGTPLEKYCRASQFIRSVINRCGGRSHPFSSDGGQNDFQVRELIEKINRLVWWNSEQAKYSFRLKEEDAKS